MRFSDAGPKRVWALACGLAVLCLALAAPPAGAQQNDPPKRPKVGLVLSGGELAGAMRASMSVPGVFAPYRLNG